MNTLIKAAIAIVLGAALGLGATWLAVFKGAVPGGVAEGPWHTSLAIGSTDGETLTRAQVAVHGLLALNRSETLYYTAATDSAGVALDGACTYAVRGRDPGARWWSITAYGPDDYLIPNPARRYSVSKTSVSHDRSGNFRAIVSAKAVGGNWIATAPGHFTLTLRLYNPDAGAASDPTHAALPAIERASCR